MKSNSPTWREQGEKQNDLPLQQIDNRIFHGKRGGERTVLYETLQNYRIHFWATNILI